MQAINKHFNKPDQWKGIFVWDQVPAMEVTKQFSKPVLTQEMFAQLSL